LLQGRITQPQASIQRNNVLTQNGDFSFYHDTADVVEDSSFVNTRVGTLALPDLQNNFARGGRLRCPVMLAREAKQELSLKAKFFNYSPQPMISVYPRVFSYSYPKLSTHTQGRNGGVGKGGTITRAPNHYGDAESLRGR